MFAIPNFLSADDLSFIRAELAKGEFTDGRFSAGDAASDVKNNLQLKRQADGTSSAELDKRLIAALTRNDLFRSRVLPKQFVPFLYSRYESGMSYGAHVDSPLMGKGRAVRADVSITVFLNDPADYDGGELQIEKHGTRQAVKLPAGHAVCYASTTLHHVEPVTRGERLVAVSWVQSFIRDEAQREIVHDLGVAGQLLTKQDKQSREANLVLKSHANLLRMWVDV